VIIEVFTEDPIINLRAFKNLSFSFGSIVLFITFFNLLGSIVLLPIYLQRLMGYTATLSGIVLGPGGMVTLIALPVAGKLVTKVNPKVLLAFCVITCSYATHLMSQFNLLADFNSIIWPRVVLGLGMGFLFIPLTALTLSKIKKEEMGNATSIFNLLRNLGGSFGVAFVTTILARREQFHQVRLVEHLTSFDRNFQLALPQISQVLQGRGLMPSLSSQGSLGLIYNRLIREASMLSFNDVFHLLSVLTILILPLVLLMRGGEK